MSIDLNESCKLSESIPGKDCRKADWKEILYSLCCLFHIKLDWENNNTVVVRPHSVHSY